MIIRGTTPTESFTIPQEYPVDLANCTQIWATITDSSGKDYVFEKDRMTVDADAGTIAFDLTQEDTLKFAVGAAKVQLRFLYNNGKAFASYPMRTRVLNVRKDGKIE